MNTGASIALVSLVMGVIVADGVIVWTHGKTTMLKYGGAPPELMGWRGQLDWVREYGRICREQGLSQWGYRFMVASFLVLIGASILLLLPGYRALLLVAWAIVWFLLQRKAPRPGQHQDKGVR